MSEFMVNEMTVIEKLKAESMRLRKERSPVAPSIQFAISEIEKVGKNAGNRVTTEDEAIKAVQKIVATLRENLKVTTAAAALANVNTELAVLESVLPQMVTAEEIRSQLVFAFDGAATKNKGEVMKWARARWGALADMKTVGAVANELWGV